MKKIKHKNMPDELAMLRSVKKGYRRVYYNLARDIRMSKKLKLKIHLYRKVELAVAYLSFYYAKKGYIYFHQKKILKKNIKKPRYKKLKVKINKISYTRDELFKILFGGALC